MSTAARIEELRKKFAESPRRYFAPLANELRKAGDLQSAIALCREHLPKQPGHMSGYIVFGQALYETESLDEARMVFEQALTLDPENLIALRHLGDIARRQGDVGAARRWYERVLDTDPRNDDIAAQLTRLATPVYPAISVTPTPGVPMPVVPAPVAELQPVSFTPSVPIPTIGAVVPTPDSVLRAVDFDKVNAGLRTSPASSAPVSSEPLTADVHDSQAGSNDPELRSDSSTADDLIDIEGMVLTGPGVVADEDPFAFGDNHSQEAETASSADLPDEAAQQADDVDFIEGLAAPEWPDTAELEARVLSPRVLTPSSVPITPEAVEAFGRETSDQVNTALPSVEDDVTPIEPDLAMSADVVLPVVPPIVPPVVPMLTDVTAGIAVPVAADHGDSVPEPVAEAVVEAAVESEAYPQAVLEAESEGEYEGESEGESLATQSVEHQATEPVRYSPAAEQSEAASYASLDDDLGDHNGEHNDEHSGQHTDIPWLTGPEVALGTVGAIVEAIGHDAQKVGDSDVVHLQFADELQDDSQDEADTVQEALPEGAFVTETMGELLVSQGFVEKAIAVYETLVAQKPYDPVLAARLAELREMVELPLVETPQARAQVQVTARERFKALALRRVARRTPRFSTAVAFETTPVSEHLMDASSHRLLQVADYAASLETADSGLTSLFGGSADPVDDSAARVLAQAFARAIVESSLGVEDFFEQSADAASPDSLFSLSDSVAAGSVESVTAAEPELGAAADEASDHISFDRFFPDAALQSTSVGDRQPVRDNGPSSTSQEETPGAADDLAQFSAWLKGLGNA